MQLASGVQLLSLLYLAISDLTEQPLPITELNKQHVTSLIHSDNVCPFIIDPPLRLKTERDAQLEYSNNRLRQLSWISSSIDISNAGPKLHKYAVALFGCSTSEFMAKVEHQLSFSQFFDAIYSYSSEEVRRVERVQLYLLHVGALLAAYTLWRKPIDVQTPLRSLTPLYKTRFLVLCYAIGHTTVSPSTRDLLNDDTHDIAFFLVWFVTTGLVHFVSAVLHTTIRRLHATSQPNYSILHIAYIIFVICSSLFVVSLLVCVVLPRSAYLKPAYAVLLTADALGLLMTLICSFVDDVIETTERRDSDVELWRFASAVLNATSDVFQLVFILCALQIGLMLRRKLILLSLISYSTLLMNRLVTFSYPTVN